MESRSRSHLKTVRVLAVWVILAYVVLQPVWAQAGRAAAPGEAAVFAAGHAPAVVYVSGDGHVHEIVLRGTWQDHDLTALSGAPVARSGDAHVYAFQREDGVCMVVYRGEDAHIHSIYLEFDRLPWGTFMEDWTWADLTVIAGSPAAGADPVGYVRSDGISAVVYTGSDGHIYELRLEGTWIAADLSALAVAPLSSSSPVAYVRGDGVNAIVHVASYDGHIIELALGSSGWQWADLTALTLAPLPMSPLSAYVRSEGISTINYAGPDGHIHDLRLEGSWIWSDLTLLSGAPGTMYRPFGYVRADGINAIVYSTAGMTPNHIYEMRLENGWEYYELTSVPNAVTGIGPVGYVRADGVSAVVYRGWTVGHIHEIWLGTGWNWADLSSLAGAGEGINPWPYNRSVISFNYLPLALR